METKQSMNLREKNDEMDLIQLLLAIWKNKILIICITVISSILAGILGTFALPHKYISNLNIVINMPESYKTEYGDYVLPITTNTQYINLILSNDVLKNTIRDLGDNTNKLTIEDLKDKIKIDFIETKETEQNCFGINITASNPKEAVKIAKALYKNYIEFIAIMTKESTVEFYSDQFLTEIKKLNKEIEKNDNLIKENEALLANVRKTINRNDVKNLVDSNNVMIIDEVINPNYTKVESDIIALKQANNINKNTINIYNSYLDKLKSDRKAIDKYYETGELDANLLETNVVSTSIFLPSSPTVPTRDSGTSIVKMIAIGIIVGAFIGCVIALIKTYLNIWRSKNNIKF